MLAYLSCSILAIPFLDFVKERNYAATISLNTLLLAVGLQNAFILLARLSEALLGNGFFASIGRRLSNDAFFSASDVAIPRRVLPFPILLALVILLGPLVVDRLRDTVGLADGYVSRWKGVPGTYVGVLSMAGVPVVTLDAGADFAVKDPYVMPRDKWMNDFEHDEWPKGRVHWIPASNLLDYGRDRIFSRHLLISDSLLHGHDLGDVDTLVVRMDTTRYGKIPFIYTKATEVLHISPH